MKQGRHPWRLDGGNPTVSSHVGGEVGGGWRLGHDLVITYGALEATSDNFAFLAQMELIKLCDAPESNRIITGCSLRKNVPASTSSLVGISSTVV
jgi:hypothetical protein